MPRQRANRVFYFAIAFVLIALLGCTSAHERGRTHKKQYGVIYQSKDGHYYTRSYNDDMFWYWMFTTDNNSLSSTTNFNQGSWTRVSGTPTGLTETSKVVEEEDGIPTQEVEEETAIPQEEPIGASTTQAEAEASGQIESDADNANGDDAGASDGGTDGGGGDAGGGDGGGGGD